MAAKGMTSQASVSFSRQHQVLDSGSLNCPAKVPSAISRVKHGFFTRAHSLEIPDANGDTPMNDPEFQDTSDFLCVSEEFWHDIAEMSIEMECTRPTKRLKCESDLDFNCYGSPACVDTTDGGTQPVFEHRPKKPKRVKRISNKQKIIELRDEVNELMAQLQTLETASLRGEENGGAVVMSRRSEFWGSFAARQLEQRQRAEEENEKLREMMKIQIQEAGSLRRVLERRINHVAATAFELL